MFEPDGVGKAPTSRRRPPDQAIAVTADISFAGELEIAVGRCSQANFFQPWSGLLQLDRCFDLWCSWSQAGTERHAIAQVRIDGRISNSCAGKQGCREQRDPEPRLPAVVVGPISGDQDDSSLTRNDLSSRASPLQAAACVRAISGSGRISAGTMDVPRTAALTAPADLPPSMSQTAAS